jgi:2-amino-4-hydroxy-6-hydroxymethyldihydropteridine diphosphokinase
MPDAPAVTAALSLGGNVGDVAAAFDNTLDALRAHERIANLRASRIYVTPPWGKTDQPDFLNMAAAFETTLTPRELLALIRELEARAGRTREERWGPRTLDLDIILYGDQVIDEPDLQIPHPRAHERAFVLVPLAEIMPEARIHGSSVRDLAKMCDAHGMKVRA